MKDQLRANTEEAAARGVFGVPSLAIDGEVFWGADAIGFAKAFLADPATVRNAEMRRVKNDEDRKEYTYSSMTLFYLNRWRSNSLTRLQRVIFVRYLDSIIASVERDRRELERLRKKG